MENFEKSSKDSYLAWYLYIWTWAFIDDHHNLPYSSMGIWNTCLLDQKPELKAELNAYLLGIGKYIRALDIIEFMDDIEVQLQHGLTKRILLSTAQVWMHKLDYC